MDLRAGLSPSVRLANCQWMSFAGRSVTALTSRRDPVYPSVATEQRTTDLTWSGGESVKCAVLANQLRPVLRSPSSRTMSASPSDTAASTERPSEDHETRRTMNVGRPPKSVI